MKYRAVIFDLDGVICHTDRYHYEAWAKIAEELELHFDEALGNRLRGIGRQQSFEIILKSNGKTLSPEDISRYTDRKNEIYQALLVKMTPDDLERDVRKTLDAVRTRGMKLAVGSSSKNTKFILKRLGLDSFFNVVSDGTDIQFPKPDPEVFLIASKRLDVPPNACIVVEDAQAGIEAAAAGGMDSAAIGNAVCSHLATYQLKRLSDLLIYI
jgi:beta-phosphoglucomutase